MDNEAIVTADTLKAQGLTDEEIGTLIPKDESETPVVTEEVVPETPAEVVPESEVKTEKVQSLKPSVVSYDRFKEVNDKAKAYAAELAALKANPAPTVPQIQAQPIQPTIPIDTVSQAQSRAKYYTMLSTNADREAREIYGIPTDEDISTLQFTDNAKYQAYVDTRAAIVQEKDAENRQQFKIQSENQNFVNELQQDPLFLPVYNYANAEMEELPVKEVKKFKEAEAKVLAGKGTEKDFAYLREQMDSFKVKFLAAQGHVPAPATNGQTVHSASSPLDKANGLPRAQNLSGAKTAGMSWQQVEQLIMEGRIDEIPKEMLAQIDKKLIE